MWQDNNTAQSPSLKVGFIAYHLDLYIQNKGENEYEPNE